MRKDKDSEARDRNRQSEIDHRKQIERCRILEQQYVSVSLSA
jgi:hypothetical protein